MSRHYRDVQIGDVLPLDTIRLPQTETPHDPCWYSFFAAAQKETQARRWFETRGVEAWFPTEKAWRKMARGKRNKVSYKRKIAPGYVFARFERQPAWDVIFASPFVRDVVGIFEQPARITDADMLRMAELPKRLKEIAEAERERMTIREGDTVFVESGVLKGWEVKVQSINGESAEIMAGLLGRDTSIVSIQHLRKVL